MAVWVLGRPEKPLMPCPQKRTRRLLERAVVHPMVPFTIRLKDRRVEDSGLWSVRLRLAPGSKTSVMVLMRDGKTVDSEGGEVSRSATVLLFRERKHRGQAIREALRRRARRCPRRCPVRPSHPTLRVACAILPIACRCHPGVDKMVDPLPPVTALSQELVPFDIQPLQNPEIGSLEEQQGTLLGRNIC